MGRLIYGFKHTFKTVHTNQPGLHEMHVLQKNPVSIFGGSEKSVFSDKFLSLSHGNIG
jgi:hypothetical protein